LDDFTKHSKIKESLFHRTTPEGAKAIRENGPDVDMTSERSVFGNGFYMSTQPLEQYGEDEVRAAVKAENPFEGDVTEVDAKTSELMDKIKKQPAPEIEVAPGVKINVWTGEAVRGALRQAWLDEGYDAVRVKSGAGGENDVVVILDPATLGILDKDADLSEVRTNPFSGLKK
jgi:hypothetical protein